MPVSHASGSARSSGSVVASQKRRTSAGSSRTRNPQPWLKPALGARTALRSRPLDDRRVDGVGRRSRGPSCGGVRRPGTPWGRACLTDDFERMWADLAPVGRSASSGGYFRQPWLSAERELAAWFEEQCVARGLVVARDAIGNVVAWWGSPGPGAVVTGSHLDSVLDGGAYDGPLGVVSALAAVDVLRARGFAPSRPLGRLGVRGGGGVAVRAGLPGVAAGDWRGVVGGGAGAARPRRGVPGRRARRPPGCPGAPDRALLEGVGDVRRAARRAGPRPGRPRRGGRGGERDLAARAVPLRVPRVRRPRGHDADGGPRRPDADLRDDRAGRQQAGPAGRSAGDVRAARGDPELDQLRALGRDGVAGRAGVVGSRPGRPGRRRSSDRRRSVRRATAPRWW